MIKIRTELEIKSEIGKIQEDLDRFEKKYDMTSENFYNKFEKGEADDSHDFIIWAGIYEMQLNSKKELKEIKE